MNARLDTNPLPIGKSLVVESGSKPYGDVVFAPSDSRGTPGSLNTDILEALDLDSRSLPSRDELEAGYAFKGKGIPLICFVVTVQGRETAVALRENLAAALLDGRMKNARSLWLPLMGTGAGGLALEKSFTITYGVLKESGWLDRAEVQIVMSMPPEVPDTDAVFAAIAAAGSGVAKAEDRSSSAPVVYGFNCTAAVAEAFAFAASLASSRAKKSDVLSTTLLFFALAESQSSLAARELKSDRLAYYFNRAVFASAGERYADAWGTYFSKPLAQIEPGRRRLPRSTANIQRLLAGAAEHARGAGKSAIDMDHLVTALLSLERTRLASTFELMRITPQALLTELRDAQFGQIAMTLHNDVANAEDRLGYDSYAEAIAGFLSHVQTPPPLSISIQAPWGVGKSTLMKLIRKRLDPDLPCDGGEAATASPSWSSRLTLRSVLQMLDRERSFDVVTAAQSASLWTVWFNAWKYETSEQIWAGLVDSIVSQIGERLPTIEREKFLLRLQLARIDDGVVRRKIYDRVVTIWWAKARAWVLSAGAAILSFLSVGAADKLSIEPIQQALGPLSSYGFPAALIAQIVLCVYLVVSYLKSQSRTAEEPASFSLADYIRVPDYNKSVGEIHQIHADLRKVLAVVPRKDAHSDHSPIVIFIDDLDRCSPTKIANVVEGVSMLLASNTFRCMFVIGMDPQLIAAALEKAHEDMRDRLPPYERSVPLGWRFMDKFVQLPFTIPPSTGERLNAYATWLGAASTDDRERTTDGPAAAVPVNRTPVSVEGEMSVETRRKSERVAPQSVPDDHTSYAQAAAFVESRDVGRIIRRLSEYNMGNPREFKRMVNLARLYLSLRDARRRRDYTWQSPELDQYARWIALALRWPDMMRWLQWGADEVSWSAAERTKQLVVRRLCILQDIATTASTLKDWSDSLAARLGVPIERKADWACDSRLFEFFVEEGARQAARRLSAGAELAFW